MDKTLVLEKIYTTFAKWSENFNVACERGCCSCCTQSVMITANEGVTILRYVLDNNLSEWFAKNLEKRDFTPPSYTTNDFAAACLKGREMDAAAPQSMAPCPFLNNGECGIYPVRPFACRLFISLKRCSMSQPAVVADEYFEATVAVNQLIEHLGQKEYWGNMLDVLPALLDSREFLEISSKLDEKASMLGKYTTLTAQPLPGFLISKEVYNNVAELLQALFLTKVGEKTIEDILNGR